MVARLTPDQKVACSNHVRVNDFFLALIRFDFIFNSPFQNCVTFTCKDEAHKLFKTHAILCALALFTRQIRVLLFWLYRIKVVEVLSFFHLVAFEIYVGSCQINAGHHLFHSYGLWPGRLAQSVRASC